MVRRLRKRKSWWHVIAIPQASIAAPTLTVMQGFKAKKKKIAPCISFPVSARNPSANQTRVRWLEAEHDNHYTKQLATTQ